MNKVFEKLLEDLKRASQPARLKMAGRFGFSTVEAYEAYLKQPLVKGVSVKVKRKAKKEEVATVVERVTVHNVHILDASGSMAGAKLDTAIKGINDEVIEMKKDNSTEVTQTIVHFSDHNDIKTSCWKTPLDKAVTFYTRHRGSTALLETLGVILTKLLKEANGKDKVLVKIFTDGQENNTPHTSEWYNPVNVANLIKDAEAKGFTVTFIGTENDVQYVINLLKVDRSNTLVHQNTKESIGATYMMSSKATAKYRGASARGENVTKGFFTKEEGTL